MEGFLPQASLFLGIIPALVLIFISLKGYEGYYKDKTIFLTFIVGIIIGFIAAIIELTTITAGLIVIILYPLVEQVLKTMVLNIGRMQNKKETTIYGLTLGLGFGSIFTPVSLIAANIQIADAIVIASVLTGSVGIILFHGATGIVIGYGVYKRKLFKYLIFAIILHLPITGWFFITSYFDIENLQIYLIVYGVILYWYATKKIMPKILIDSQGRKRSN